MEKRPVELIFKFDRKHMDNEYKKGETVKGLFHSWGQYQEGGTDANMYALVEMADGSVLEVDPAIIRFVDTDTTSSVYQIEIFEGNGNNQIQVNEWLRNNPGVHDISVTTVPMYDMYQCQPPQICNQWISTILTYRR